MDNIVAHTTHNPRIDIAEVHGDLTGDAVFDLQMYLYDCLDFDRRYQIMNLKHTQEIDDLAINILEDFGLQGVKIGLFNVDSTILSKLNAVEKGDIMEKIYEVTDSDKAVSLFEKDVFVTDDDALNKRRYPRVSASFPCSFSIIDSKRQMVNAPQPCQDDTIVVTAKIRDLSESGILADNIIAFNPETEKEIERPEMIGNKLRCLKFRLNGNPELINTRGEFVRLRRNNGNLSAAIQFKGISKDTKKLVKEYIDSQVSD
ncbi:MAG: PilZ domain-containing protein [Candidatus Anammoxibacter sp.]